MNRRSMFSRMIMMAGIILLTMSVQGQFVAIARKIKKMATPTTDVSTVIIDKATYKLYRAVTDTLTSSPGITITKRDNQKRYVEFAMKQFTVAMQIDSLSAGLSQITVASAHQENGSVQPTDATVNAIITVCKKAGVKCTLEK
jgi:hypothetical protein